MNDNRNDGQGRVVYRLSMDLSGCCALMLGALLWWNNAYAVAEESVTVHISESANVTADVDSQSPGVENLETAAIVESTDTESKSIDSDADLSEAAQLDSSQGDQYSQLALAGSQDTRTLDVVDTGSSVEFPNALGELGRGIDDQKVNVDPGHQPETGLNGMNDQGGQPETEKPIPADADLSEAAQLDSSQGDQYSQLALAGSQDTRTLDVVDTGSSVEFPNALGELGGGIDDQKVNDMTRQGDQSLVTGTSVKLPVTNAAGAQSQVGNAGSQLTDVSNDVASEKSAGLPYAVVLALLALIGMVPVVRRENHRHV